MSRSIDTKRPQELTKAQRGHVDRHPELKLLVRTMEGLEAYALKTYKRSMRKLKGTPISDKYQRLKSDYRTKRRRLQKAYLEEVKNRYRKEQPAIDVQLQLNGAPIKTEDPDQGLVQDSLPPERVNAINSLFTFATSSQIEERKRRTMAINALTALCGVQEGSRCPPKEHSIPETKQQLATPPNSLSSSPAPEFIPTECKPTQCIFCIGDETLPTEKRFKTFHAHGDLKKHFSRKHLRYHPPEAPIDCPHPRCKLTLKNTMYLQNHAEEIHKTPT